MSQQIVAPGTGNYVHTHVAGNTGVITLDRPGALNALSAQMYRELLGALWAWADEPAVVQVLIRSSSARAFCAGGDIRQIRQAVLDGAVDCAVAAFKDEYTLNDVIAHYPKPYVALMDGYTMGGGVGLSVHGSHRVVTQNTVFAMPECAIGFFPDVGASWFLPRVVAPGRGSSMALARWLGLGGQRVSGADAVVMGLADCVVDAGSLADFQQAVISRGVEDAVAKFSMPYEDVVASAVVPALMADIDSRYGAATLGEVVASAGDDLAGAAPSSLVRTWELLNAGAVAGSVTECLERELAFARDAIAAPDFCEGVRCMLVDKADTPAWQPSTVGAVDDHHIRAVLRTSESLGRPH